MRTVCWILGRGGLLGQSLQHAIVDIGMEEFIPSEHFAWNDAERCAEQLTSAVREFRERVVDARWQIYWAAGTGTMASTDDVLARETATFATLLRLLRESDIHAGTIVYASSAGAIYAGCRDDVITETSPACPENAYGKTKLAEEGFLRAFAAERTGWSVLIARITNLYGPAQSKAKRQGLISHIARSVLRHAVVNVFVPLDTIRDYIPADDAASMIVQTTAVMHAGEILVKIIASEEPATIARIIAAFRVITRLPPRVITSTSALSASYPHRMYFRSTVHRISMKKTPLHVGVAKVLASERLALMRG